MASKMAKVEMNVVDLVTCMVLARTDAHAAFKAGVMEVAERRFRLAAKMAFHAARIDDCRSLTASADGCKERMDATVMPHEKFNRK